MDRDEEDRNWMRLALDAAARGRGMVEPNPMVGAVVVRDGRLVATGHHAQFGGPHAEAAALEAAGEQARGATLYVTLEPCCHHGKTPPCVEAILRAGVSRVVAAHRDPFPKVDGGGLSRLLATGLDVTVGPGADSAVALNAPYLKRVFTGRPYVIAKWAMTLDGKAAVGPGDSRWISSAASRALVHAVRGRMDAIVVGIGTAIADDPQLTARPPGPRTPRRVVLDSQALLPSTSNLVKSARETPTLVAVTDRAPVDRRRNLEERGCEVVVFEGASRVPIVPLLAELGRRGMTNLLVEGGGLVLGAFLDVGEVDEVDVFIAPLIEGGDHARTPARGQGRSLMGDAARLDHVVHTTIDGDLRIQGLVPQSWRARLDSLIGDRTGNAY
ncbi:MAG: bifunctional diaminohydroxyphosphoribosylaminopyrimidine deaminase/5-amino-6-(5-phosphoribosylamino)uracil reductase RibD [Paludisphaera borealis]|uniref:bifunctional diaminohydroxyphosphoribosylaminopyrimidine deaminase/5-amino-6-(5-phosphoribosylamino)uracil reductase RibD n=1 Tax=Paludisphaera borealis TaxID=1387353 RepID=UPI00284AF04B|nr:bifunctional diaminohydroxyphosphoribosylaminopyrimidine deaminase/5-amino-6-(5-phosphoribosylamino)uracil reductase RibD [Paludisphaera borealis]MDR3619715.1 bifunctional diaminohydroxyphosphoribosylaminopyrimidine deaminase/5-amino-6-(5-phosphoribosylamino)uracil reductase RibD [Paludisphaera borealis]